MDSLVQRLRRYWSAKAAKRFAFVRGPADNPASAERYLGFSRRLQDLGLPVPDIIAGDFSYQKGGRRRAGCSTAANGLMRFFVRMISSLWA